ncbi:hypothetical protein ACWGJB_48245 [Streptomyces sp. NPDC054813]
MNAEDASTIVPSAQPLTATDLPVAPGTTARQPASSTDRFDDVTEARLDHDANVHVGEDRPAKTRHGCAAAWKAWERFTAESGLPPLAVRSGALVLFVEWCRLRPEDSPGRLTAPLSTTVGSGCAACAGGAGRRRPG